MAKTNTSQTPHSTDAVPAEDDDVLRKRLLSRIAAAGVTIVGLLGALAVYDAMNKPQAPAVPKMAEVPVEVPKVIEAKPAEEKAVAEAEVQGKPVEKAEEKPEEQKVARADTAVPERTVTPLAPPAAEKPLRAPKPLTPPATAHPATVRPSAPAAAPHRPDAGHEIARVMPIPERPAVSAAPAPRPPTVHAPPSRPLTQAAEAAPRFLLQVGVFSNHANAEELLARLQQAGIPAQIESRVQVGPFASRTEADMARSKLKSIGIDDGLLVRR